MTESKAKTEISGNLIVRDLDENLKKLLDQFSTVTNRLIDFGAEIYSWDIQKGGGDEKVPANMFLRNFLETLDAISILIKNSSIEPCNSLLRIALETTFQIEYLLQNQQDQRALSFLVWNSCEQQKIVEKVDGTSPRYFDMARKYKNDKLLNTSTPPVHPEADRLKSFSKNLLSLEKYKPIKEEYERAKQEGKNRHWYSLFNGPQNLESLAREVKLEATYEALYRSWSKSSHGQDIIQGKLSSSNDEFGNLTTLIDCIRSPKNAQEITSYCFHLAIFLYFEYVTNRLPERVEDYKKWHQSISGIHLKLTHEKLITITD